MKKNRINNMKDLLYGNYPIKQLTQNEIMKLMEKEISDVNISPNYKVENIERDFLLKN